MRKVQAQDVYHWSHYHFHLIDIPSGNAGTKSRIKSFLSFTHAETVEVARKFGRKYEVFYFSCKSEDNEEQSMRQIFFDLKSEIGNIEQYTYSQQYFVSNTRN